jgi:folate-binding protein YgfZ
MLRFSGADASPFLQGQVTHDTSLLADGCTMLAACNTAKGRVVAVLRLRQSGDSIYAVTAADLAMPLLEHLKRYVLRAKVRLEIDERALVAARPGSRPGVSSSSEPLRFDWAPDRSLVAVPVDERTYAADASSAGAQLAPDPDAAVWNDWLLADIAEGRPLVTAATSGHFVAQMLNLDLLDGISFAKGCYTGQEIVARTQNLGRIKRRMLRYTIGEGTPPALLTGLNFDGQKVGEVVMSAARSAGCDVLAVTNLDARDRPLMLDDGRLAEPAPLPYAV